MIATWISPPGASSMPRRSVAAPAADGGAFATKLKL